MAQSRSRPVRHEVQEPNVTRLHEIAGTGPVRIGADLKGARQRRGLDLAELSRDLRIGQPYLIAMEEGRFEDLPGRAYAIGFLRSYANYLGLDGEALVSRYRDEGGAPVAPSELNFPEPLAPPSLPTGRIVAVALIIAVVVFGGWSVFQDRLTPLLERVAPVPDEFAAAGETTGTGTEATAQPVATTEPPRAVPEPATTAPLEPAAATGASATAATIAAEGAAALPPTETQAVLPTEPAAALGAVPAEPVEATVAPTPEVPAIEAPQEPLDSATATPTDSAAAVAVPGYVPNVYGRGNEGRIEIRATHESWVQINAPDGTAVFTRVLQPGDVYRVPDRAGLTMRTGNAGGLEVLVDGRVAPSLGGLAQVKRRIALEPEKLAAGTASD
jgi:cytoskeleton protein RodZ